MFILIIIVVIIMIFLSLRSKSPGSRGRWRGSRCRCRCTSHKKPRRQERQRGWKMQQWLDHKFIFITPEPGEPGGGERLVGDLSKLENAEEGGETKEDHHWLHQDEPGFKFRKLALVVFITLVTLTGRVLPCRRQPWVQQVPRHTATNQALSKMIRFEANKW